MSKVLVIIITLKPQDIFQMKLEPYIILLSFFFLLKQTDFYFVCNFESTSEIASSWQKTLPAQDSIYVLWPRPFFWNTVILQTFCSQFVDISENYFVSYIYQKIKLMYNCISELQISKTGCVYFVFPIICWQKQQKISKPNQCILQRKPNIVEKIERKKLQHLVDGACS